MNRREQHKQLFQEALRLAKELKQYIDTRVGDGWWDDPALLYEYDYRRKFLAESVPESVDEAKKKELKYLRDLIISLGFAGKWLEEMLDSSVSDRSAFSGMQAADRYALRQREVPEPLADFIADSSEGKGKPSMRRNFDRRNKVVVQMVGYIKANVGIPPTRNEESKHLSACDAVAKALGSDITTYRTILGIWNKRPDDTLLPLPVYQPDIYVYCGDEVKEVFKSEQKSRSELLGLSRFEDFVI